MVRRESYLKKIELFLDKPVIKVLTGLRRVGKSTLLSQIKQTLMEKGVKEKNIVFINMEFLDFNFIQDELMLYEYVKAQLKEAHGKKYILIDEIQEVRNWERAAASFLSQNMGDIIITGSNAHLLSSELATLITGRYVQIQVYPLGFSEFLLFRKNSGNISGIREEFITYLRYGGLPGIHFLPLIDEAVFSYLNSVLSTILLKDVVKRHQIREVDHLERISNFVMDNCGNITTAKSISDYFKANRVKISVETVQNYLEYLTQAFLTYRVKRYDLKGKRHLEFFDKYYMGDIGLRNGNLGYKENNISGLLKNVVFIELLRRGYQVFVGVSNDLEIDFIAEKQNERHYFQVCYLLADKKTQEREFGNLEKIKDNYPKTVLSLDLVFQEQNKGILWKNLIEWLQE